MEQPILIPSKSKMTSSKKKRIVPYPISRKMLTVYLKYCVESLITVQITINDEMAVFTK